MSHDMPNKVTVNHIVAQVQVMNANPEYLEQNPGSVLLKGTHLDWIAQS